MRLVAMVLWVFSTWAGLACAEPRIALVIGNSGYQSISGLENADNDAELMKTSLESVGFEVTLLVDASHDAFKRGVAEFGRALRAAGPEATGLFYYAGHGVQSFGLNYLLPVDAALTDAADLDLVALEASSILRQMASARNLTNIVILDACRNNPFETIRELNDNGLAEMKAPTGTFLSYATAPGKVAMDGTDGNSPFTKALAQNITIEGKPIEKVMKDVRISVLEQTGGQQAPWDTSSLVTDFVFKPGQPMTAEEFAEQQLWASVKETRDTVQLMLFLRNYPRGQFEGEARSLLAELIEGELGTAPAPKSTQPQPTVDPVVPAEAPKGDLEMQLMETAQASGTIADYQAYLDAFPAGMFAELVRVEIAALQARENTTPAPVEKTAPPASGLVKLTGDIFYDKPLPDSVEAVAGQTIAQAAEGEPLFSPIEGFPEELWRGKSCTNCHQWSRDALCTQGQTYTREAGAAALEKSHPYGGGFKQVLRHWAEGGCR